MKLKNLSEVQRLALTRAYIRQLMHVCKTQYEGDWDAMPRKVKIDWNQVYVSSKIRGLELKQGTIAKIIAHVPEPMLEKACELEDRG